MQREKNADAVTVHGKEMSDSPHERICGEVNSKCATLRAASRLLKGLSALETEEMLLLMTEEALRLAKSLEAHRQDSFRR